MESCSSVVRALALQVRDLSSIPGRGRNLGQVSLLHTEPNNNPSKTKNNNKLRTAHSCLDLFKGNTGVIHRLLGVELSRLPSNAERFRDWAVVLADSPLSSGRHYWEVTVKRSQEFRIGVAEVNMSREECIGANETSWVYAYMQRKWYSMASNEVVPVSLFGKPQRVGLLLDCQGRKLSLVDVEKGSVVDTMLIEMRSPVTPAFALWDGQLVTHPGLETPEGV
uniref:SPRY domain containing 4 n=1 Tax=Callorhinchus milii TaxID=7868 RepID=A0A4W3INL5_CALMI